MKGIGRTKFFLSFIGVCIWSGLAAALGDGSGLRTLAIAMWLAGAAWYLLWAVPARLRNAEMSLLWWLAIFVPFLNIVVFLMLMLVPGKVDPAELEADIAARGIPRRDHFVESLSAIVFPKYEDDEKADDLRNA